jgi:hypothetical protein
MNVDWRACLLAVAGIVLSTSPGLTEGAPKRVIPPIANEVTTVSSSVGGAHLFVRRLTRIKPRHPVTRKC